MSMFEVVLAIYVVFATGVLLVQFMYGDWREGPR